MTYETRAGLNRWACIANLFAALVFPVAVWGFVVAALCFAVAAYANDQLARQQRVAATKTARGQHLERQRRIDELRP